VLNAAAAAECAAASAYQHSTQFCAAQAPRADIRRNVVLLHRLQRLRMCLQCCQQAAMAFIDSPLLVSGHWRSALRRMCRVANVVPSGLEPWPWHRAMGGSIKLRSRARGVDRSILEFTMHMPALHCATRTRDFEVCSIARSDELESDADSRARRSVYIFADTISESIRRQV